MAEVEPVVDLPTLGYWKIRGLAAAVRMMYYYKAAPFKEVAYGEDAAETWFGGDKPVLAAKNSLINLPYIIDGDVVVTQSNSCLLYLGQKLAIDLPEHMIRNHQVLDQTIDLRNALMKIAYGPEGKEFKPALEGHMDGANGVSGARSSERSHANAAAAPASHASHLQPFIVG
jgi:glutathione S-transferase